MRAEIGIGTAARGMATAFEAVGIPFNVINFERGSYASHTNDSWVHKEVRQSRYDITVVCVNPDNSFNLRTQVSPEILGNRYVIGYWFWELPEMPDAWLSDFEFTDEVWAASTFITDAISGKAPVPVVRVPPVVQLTPGKRFSRAELGLPDGRFLFLAMFDTKSVLHRKNPLGVLRAFSNAFRPDDASVGLVLKFNDPDYRLPVLRTLRDELADREQLVEFVRRHPAAVDHHLAPRPGQHTAEAGHSDLEKSQEQLGQRGRDEVGGRRSPLLRLSR